MVSNFLANYVRINSLIIETLRRHILTSPLSVGRTNASIIITDLARARSVGDYLYTCEYGISVCNTGMRYSYSFLSGLLEEFHREQFIKDCIPVLDQPDDNAIG